MIAINYRVGLFGFFAHEELTESDPAHPTNFGLLDQVLALEWVNDNIAYFGGDIKQLTVFGKLTRVLAHLRIWQHQGAQQPPFATITSTRK